MGVSGFMMALDQADHLDNSDVVDFSVFGVELPRLNPYAQEMS